MVMKKMIFNLIIGLVFISCEEDNDNVSILDTFKSENGLLTAYSCCEMTRATMRRPFLWKGGREFAKPRLLNTPVQ